MPGNDGVRRLLFENRIRTVVVRESGAMPKVPGATYADWEINAPSRVAKWIGVSCIG
jgi:hypothetical protein